MKTPEREDPYRTNDHQSSRDLRLKKLQHKMREHIRKFHYHPVLSDGWISMADKVSQVAEVAFMEMGVPFKTDTKLVDLMGRKTDGTLWDQENDQLAVKILIEEGKINLCLRLLHEFKEMCPITPAKAASIRREVGKKKINDKVVMLRVDQFEKGIGIILHFSFQHEEVLQILDTSVLIQNIAVVLRNAEDRKQLFEGVPPKRFSSDFNGSDKLQESVVFCFLASLGHHVEKLDEERIMHLLDENEILTLSINHMSEKHHWYAYDVLAAYFVFLHSIFDTETFLSDKDAFIHDTNLKRKLINLHDTTLKDMLIDTKLSKLDVAKCTETINQFRFELERHEA